MLSGRELNVLEILWKNDAPLMATDIVNLGDGGMTQSTVTAVLRKLLQQGIVEVCGVTHSGKVLSRTYRPTDKAWEEVIKHMLENYLPFKDIIPIDELKKRIKNAK